MNFAALALIRPSGTFSHASAGEGNKFAFSRARLGMGEGADRRMRALFVGAKS